MAVAADEGGLWFELSIDGGSGMTMHGRWLAEANETGAITAARFSRNELAPPRGRTMPQPNVIWILGDQHRAQALGCAGDPNVRTPNIDALAASGTHFARAVSGFPLCCPFRGSMLTGEYPHRCVPGNELPMPAGMPTIADAMRAGGYHTAYFGKWHVYGHPERGPAGKRIVPPGRRGGFDTWVGYENNNAQYDCWVHGGQGDETFQYLLPGYETDELTNLLIRHLERRAGADQPFFAALSVQPPHDPYTAPPEHRRRFRAEDIVLSPNVPPISDIRRKAREDLAGYYAQIENLDDNVGRVLAALDRLNLRETTYLMFFSDHGDLHGAHGQWKKIWPYEESIRIPFIVSGGAGLPGRAGPSDVPLNHVDIAPTTLGLCGLPVPGGMRGSDCSGIVTGRGRPDDGPDSAFLQCVIPILTPGLPDRPWRGVVTRDGWKYVVTRHGPWMLHDLNEDPHELVNRLFDPLFADRRAALHNRLAAWIDQTGDSFELPAC